MNSKRLSLVAVLFPIVLMSALAGYRWQLTAAVPPEGSNAKANIKNSDCPMFGCTPQRNMVNLIDRDIPITWNVEVGKQKNIKWVAVLGGNHSYGGPVIAGGKVYVGTNVKGKTAWEKAILLAFNEADGKLLWKIVHEFPDDDLFNEGKGSGLCSAPFVEGNRLYYVTPGCEVVCASTDGKIVWTYDMMKKLKVIPFHLSNCSPLVVGDLVILITGNGVDGEGNVASPKAPSFIAVNKKTGKLAWQSNLPGAKVIEGQFTNPALATVKGKEQVIFAAGDGVIYSLEPQTGNLIWKCNCLPVRKAKQDRGIDNHFMASPVVVGDRLYIGMGIAPGTGQISKFSYMLCLDITKKGDVSFKSYDVKSPANKNSALIWAFGGLIEPRPERGREARFGSTMSTACVHDGLVYVAEERGFLHCLDAKTGLPYWDHDFKEAVWGSAYYVDGKVYIGVEDGSIIAFAPGKQKKILATNNMEDEVRSNPVVANGVLYITTLKKLYAIR